MQKDKLEKLNKEIKVVEQTFEQIKTAYMKTEETLEVLKKDMNTLIGRKQGLEIAIQTLQAQEENKPKK